MDVAQPKEGLPNTAPQAVNLAPFYILKGSGRAVQWPDRAAVIRQHFPAVASLNWRRTFADEPDVLAAFVRDILRFDLGDPNKDGPKPKVDREIGLAKLRQLAGEDYSCLPFHQALTTLGGGRSVAQLAHKTGIPRTQLIRLLDPEKYRKERCTPNAWELRTAAHAFGKDPSYWLEWRCGLLAGVLYQSLFENPEASIGHYRRLMQQRPL